MNARRLAAAALVVAGSASAGFAADGEIAGDFERGRDLYRACAVCHALAPGLHTSGPSLAGVTERQAGTAEGYERYSPGLRDAGFAWDEAALDAWLADPRAMIEGTYMSFRGVEDATARADLIAFLMQATRPGAAMEMAAKEEISAAYIRGPAPRMLADAPDFARVSAIRHCGDSFFISTADGAETPYWEKNVRLKLDSQQTGPPPGAPVIVGSGMQGDRVSVIFSSLGELQGFIAEDC